MEWKVREISGYMILWDAYRHAYVVRDTDGNFIASCDNWTEVEEEIEEKKDDN